MNKTASNYSHIHSITFGIFFVLNTILDYYIYPKLYNVFSGIIVALISAAVALVLYGALFLIIKQIYRLIFNAKNKKLLNLNGTWYHVHIPRTADGDFVKTDKLRAGEANIRQDFYDIHISAHNDYVSAERTNEAIELLTDRTRPTDWSYVTSRFDDEHNSLYGCYHTRSTTHKSVIDSCPYCESHFDPPKEIKLAQGSRYGVHALTINSECISGKYMDAFPSLGFGDVEFYRDKEMRDAKIKEYYKNNGEFLKN